MTNLNANALEQDADDDDDTVDSWIQYLKAPELTYQHQNILQSLNETSIQDVTYLKPVGHVEGPYTITTKQDGTPKKPRDDGLFKALNSAKNNGEEVVKDWIPKAKPNLLVVADYVLALQITTLNAKSRASLAVWLWEEGVKLHNESFLLVASSASFLGHCSAAWVSSPFALHRVLEQGAQILRYMDE